MVTIGHGARIDERRAILRRILSSRQIEKSTRIRDLLAYVCEKALIEELIEIHEQEIGIKVFGRKADYDTMADNVVRVTASQARRKVEQYFATDGVWEPVILEIPKGQYTPVFRERARRRPSLSPQPARGPSRFLRFALRYWPPAPFGWQSNGAANAPFIRSWTLCIRRNGKLGG